MLKAKLCKTPDGRMLKVRLYRNTTMNAETAATSNRKMLKWCRNIKQEPAETSTEMPHRKLLKQYINTKQENAQTVQKHQTGKCSNSTKTPNRKLQKQCRNIKQKCTAEIKAYDSRQKLKK